MIFAGGLSRYRPATLEPMLGEGPGGDLIPVFTERVKNVPCPEQAK
jgi:hypothetical protein